MLLSGHFGKGHDVVAEACAAALAPRGVESRILDSIALLGRRGGGLGDWVFQRMLALPPVYDAFHFSALRPGGRVAELMDRASLARMWKAFEHEVEQFPPDLVVAVFATGAAAATRLKARHPAVTTVVLCTDSYLHKLWVHQGTDLFVVTSRMAAESVRRFQPRAEVAIVPGPVRPAFYDAPDRGTARSALGVPVDARCVLLMSGSWGIGPLDASARVLGSAGYHVLAVAGTNRRLEDRLRAVASEHATVHPFGFTDRVAELMAACDVVVTSSGDTCSEARVVGRGLVLLDVVPGHGRENLMHELELGNATVCGPGAESVLASVDAFLDGMGRSAPPPRRTREEWDQGFLGSLARVGFVVS